jgi:hypothetical protein
VSVRSSMLWGSLERGYLEVIVLCFELEELEGSGFEYGQHGFESSR